MVEYPRSQEQELRAENPMTSSSPGTAWEKQIDDDGEFRRRPTSFRQWVKADGSSGYPPEAGRYHLYVSYACPWAHRTLIGRALKGLEEVITVDVVHPLLGDKGWALDPDFQGSTGDTVNGFEYLREAYLSSAADYDGGITVPVLWDRQTEGIVNNESAEILRMLDQEFGHLGTRSSLDLYPEALQSGIDEINEWVYSDINNGVYRCGFARSQAAYGRAFSRLFSALDRVERVLQANRYLMGERFTEADVRLFTTLVRFDPVYVTHFKTNQRRIVDYPALWGYLREIYQLPGVAEPTDMEHIKYHYFVSHRSINPTGIVPEGPEVDLMLPHDRDHLPGVSVLP